MTLFPIDRVMPMALRAAKLRGVHLAIVVDNKDGGDNPGYRVKVKFPWMNDQETSYWARIAVPMAGGERGTYVLPETDDQLLVVFEHGDINRPIVIGALWSKKQEPVENNDSAKNNTKLIKSRTGHRIVFDDKEGAERIVIVDKTKKNKIVLDAVNKVIKIESDADIEIKASANVVMHSNALKVGTSETFTAKGQQVLAHTASSFGLKASSNIKIDGSQVQINVSNSPATNVSGSGSGELGGVSSGSAGEQVTPQAGASGGGAGGAGGAGGGAGA
ncbi:MAG TPA: phage baseplate assembly protein V, partial [Kofleriaceae bacterium]|nr:phage baseplate assembly protein V [Kofleriaceae bacterium]